MVALTMAAMAPERIARVAVIGSGVVFARNVDYPTGAGAEVMQGYAQGAKENPAQLLKRFFGLATLGMPREQAQRLRKELLPGEGDFLPSSKILGAGLQILAQADLTETAAKVQVPVLVMHGMRDRVCHPDLGRALACRLGATTQVAWAVHGSAGHAPHWSDPAWVAAALRAFNQTFSAAVSS